MPDRVIVLCLCFSRFSGSVDLDRFDAKAPALLRESGLNAASLRARLCTGKPHAIPASPSAIAAQVGYATQGNFTQAFKDVAQTLPTAYRKAHREQSLPV